MVVANRYFLMHKTYNELIEFDPPLDCCDISKAEFLMGYSAVVLILWGFHLTWVSSKV